MKAYLVTHKIASSSQHGDSEFYDFHLVFSDLNVIISFSGLDAISYRTGNDFNEGLIKRAVRIPLHYSEIYGNLGDMCVEEWLEYIKRERTDGSNYGCEELDIDDFVMETIKQKVDLDEGRIRDSESKLRKIVFN